MSREAQAENLRIGFGLASKVAQVEALVSTLDPTDPTTIALRDILDAPLDR